MRIAIEATGSDGGFETILNGIKLALKNGSKSELVLVAGKDKLPLNYKLPTNILLIETNFTYDSNVKPNQVGSSICEAIEMHGNNEFDAVIAPGDTRGAVRFGYKILGLMPNVLSPAIPIHWPMNNVMLDSGANIECRPENLYQFAIMGNVFSKHYLGVESPLISVITNGIERQKGSRTTKKAKRLIDKLDKYEFNISEGFFEGTSYQDKNAGIVGVIGGEGGNIALKIAETAFKIPLQIFKEEFMKQNFLKKAIGYWAMRKPFKKLKQSCDPKEYATAPLLGVNGNIMICHGGSDVETIANAVRVTEKYLQANVKDRLGEDMIKYGEV